MKIRNGFVSNSSSSSFIAFDPNEDMMVKCQKGHRFPLSQLLDEGTKQEALDAGPYVISELWKMHEDSWESMFDPRDVFIELDYGYPPRCCPICAKEAV